MLQQKCIVLNRLYQAIHERSIEEAISQMFAGAATGMVINGIDEFYPVSLDEWLKLPLREGVDVGIHTSRMVIREPRVVIAVNFSKIPKRRPKLTLRNVARAYDFKCAYTGEQLTPDRWSLDHVKPKSRGGLHEISNLVLADKKVNNFKSDRTPQECGLPIPKIRKLGVETIHPSHPDHEHFLAK